MPQVGRRTGPGALAATVLLALAACTGSGDPDASAPGSSSTGTTSAPPRPPAPPTASSDPPGPGSSPPRTDHDQPLVIAVHHTSRLEDVPVRRARRIVDGRSTLDVAAGPPRRAVRDVVRDPAKVAVVPAATLGPQVRALAVDGVDPVREPEEYPLRTAAPDETPPVVTVTLVGDIMLGRGVAEAARGSSDPAPALRPTAARLASADITVGNLENTLSRAGAPRQGGDSFAADPAVVQGLRNAGFDVLGLANNHAGDFGDRALVQTVRRLREGGIDTFGAGRDPRQAWQPAVVERHGTTVGFLGFNAIGETPAVAPGQPGAVSVSMPPRTGPLDEDELRRFARAVRRLAGRVEAVIVLPHWGTQYTNRPEPVQRQVARRLVRAGADVVVGGHPHWLQGTEMVRGRLVVHSLGNFVFDMDFMQRTQEGAVLELTFWGGELKAADFVPYVMDERFAPRFVTGRRAAGVLSVMRQTSGAAFGG